uniref:NADH-ubiquinone oxidoreductase chain 5 n=1 Tax=Liposcelis nr. bostrychophila AZ TaxID=1643344 RepID=A0A0F6RA72_9NEOP|nr:NADH dehydrogenase subunit 5 [Liposcelis nr. bostrychophila AZ]
MIKIFTFLFMIILNLILTILLCLGKEIFMEISTFSIFSSFSWSWTWKIDLNSMIFSFIVLWVSSTIYFFSLSYMNHDREKLKFFTILFLFIFSMYILIFSFSLSSLLIGWDGLGVTSFLLIFYYHSLKSINSSLITLLINRLGDLFMIFSIGTSLIYFSWNFVFWDSTNYMLLLMIFAFFTKSAQIPFSFWLPKAMAAPTPVSSLVHSSTLVTAGAYTLFRLPFQIWENMSNLVFFFSSLTLLVSSIMAFSSFDCKEIVAFSTMSHMSLIFMTLSLNLHDLAFFHLCSHALFKSLLFMCVGNLIFHEAGWQDIRKLNYNSVNPLTSVSGLISLISMSGLPFMCGFYSKDAIFETISDCNTMNIFIISSLLTMSYSIRLLAYMINNYFTCTQVKKITLMNFMIYAQSFIVTVSGSMFFWWINPPFFVYPMMILKIFMIFFLISGLIAGLMKTMFFKYIIKIYHLWFKMIYEINFIFIKSKLIFNLEKGWLKSLISLLEFKYKVTMFSVLAFNVLLLFVLNFFS